MFVQVMEGKTSDPSGLRGQLDRWQQELRPGAEGYLGATMGLAADGTFVALVRFESEDAARRNSDRPEQGEWWQQTQDLFDGEVTFRDCPEVDLYLGGGSDEAGFVQVIQGRARDKAGLKQLEQEILSWLPDLRPDLIGGFMAWEGDFFTEAAYFRSEAEAREGERKVGASDRADEFQRWMDQVEGIRFVDLEDPWLYS